MKNNKMYEKIMIGKTMQTIRKSLGLTQEQVAEKLYLAPRYISDIERDKTKGSIDTLVKLCNIYHVTPSFVLKDYLNTTQLEYDDKLIGFTHLNPNEKEIIIKLIEFMNAQKNNQWTYHQALNLCISNILRKLPNYDINGNFLLLF